MDTEIHLLLKFRIIQLFPKSEEVYINPSSITAVRYSPVSDVDIDVQFAIGDVVIGDHIFP